MKPLYFSLFALCCFQLSAQDLSKAFWYDQPAEEWVEALPIGNGHLGAMIFGKPSLEHMQLNEDSMWPGSASWGDPAGTPEDLEKLRRLLLDNKADVVDSLIVERFSRKGVTRSHQTAGDLWFDFTHKDISEYRRALDITTAVSHVSFRTEGSLVTQTTFASHPADAIIIRWTSEHPGGLNGRIRLTRLMDAGEATAVTVAHRDRLVMTGQCTQRTGMVDSEPIVIEEGASFMNTVQVLYSDGSVSSSEDYLEVASAHELVLAVTMHTDWYDSNYKSVAKKHSRQLEGQDFQSLLQAHVKDYKSLYDRLSLDLGPASAVQPIDRRLQEVKAGGVDLGLETLLFQYGRYLLISCSRPGTNPANLQGLWNHHITAPWNADYHLNINLQMNYWPAEVTNLSELHDPFFDFIDRLLVRGQVTAQENFGCRGAFLPHATDLWGPTWWRAARPYWGTWVGAGGWLLNHYWDRFQFTSDTAFLKERLYPALEKVALFYHDWLIEDPRDGKLVAAPSTSPENQYVRSDGEPVAICVGAAMDQQIIDEVFEHFLRASEMLKIHSEVVKEVTLAKSRLRSGLQVGVDGRLLEWDQPYEEYEKGHRHMSHLYAFYPGNEISPSKNSHLIKAVRKSLDYRLAHGGAGTGWSRAWLINCAARLHDGDMAHDHIQFLLKRSIYPNLFDGHPPFQIDGNFGYTSGVAEMLMQSHEESIIRLLPSLPSAWKRGRVKGLKARGGYTVNFSWDGATLQDVEIQSEVGGSVQLEAHGLTHDLSFDPRETKQVSFEDW